MSPSDQAGCCQHGQREPITLECVIPACNCCTPRPLEYRTLRALLSGMAMQGDWAAQDVQDMGFFQTSTPTEQMRERAALYVRMADALLAELSAANAQPDAKNGGAG